MSAPSSTVPFTGMVTSLGQRSELTIPEGGSMPTCSLGVGAVATNSNGGTVTAEEKGVGAIHQTVLTFEAFRVIVGNTTGVSFGGAKFYDFPAGRILVLGCTAYFPTITFGSTIGTGGSGDYAIGTAVNADGDLGDATDVDLLPSSAMLDPFVTRTGRSNAGTALAAAAQFDGTTTAKDAYLNVIVDDADVSDGDTNGTVDFTGTVTLTWINLGDYVGD